MDPDPPAPTSGRSLAQAVITALILLGLIVICYILGPVAFFILAVTVVLVALFELLDALVQTGHRPNIYLGVLAGFALMLIAFLETPEAVTMRRAELLLTVLAVTLFVSFLLALRPGRGPTAASDVAWTLTAVLWVGGGGAGAVSMLQLGDDGTLLLIASVLITALNDIGAFFTGVTFGKHRMAPSISPKKSWEGFVGGMLSCLAGGCLFAFLLFDLDLFDGLIIGGICSLVAPVGDLMESLAKREIGIKDSGRLLPGHGGLFDRLDAILVTSPAVFLYLQFVVF